MNWYVHHYKEFGHEPVTHFTVPPQNVSCWFSARVLFFSRLSSEDGEEASAYFYESDDSFETRAKAPSQGEMDLLGEILDTLSTHSSDQGKLAVAKSLDFFRSMDEIDYKPTVSQFAARNIK